MWLFLWDARWIGCGPSTKDESCGTRNLISPTRTCCWQPTANCRSMRAARVRAHLDSCWTCRARIRDIDNAIVEFIHARNELRPPLPPADGARALLRLRLAQLADSSKLGLWARIGAIFRSRAVGLAWSAGLALLVIVIGWRSIQPVPDLHLSVGLSSGFDPFPNPRLTPWRDTSIDQRQSKW